MTEIKKISGIYLLDVDSLDGVKYLKLSGAQMIQLAEKINYYIKIT